MIGWSYRKKITIKSSKVQENVTNFPVYVDLTDLGSDFFDNVKSDGSDIVITESDGITKCKRELVYIDTGAEEGELHFKANLSSSTDTIFYIYYGNSSASETNDTDTWDTPYKMVQHLNEDPYDGTGEDSTSNNKDIITTGFETPSIGLVSGQVRKAWRFDGVDAQGDISGVVDADIPVTISFWANSNSFSGDPKSVIDGTGAANLNVYLVDYKRFYFYITYTNESRDYVISNTDINWDEWNYMTIVLESGSTKLYQNGVLVGSESLTAKSIAINLIGKVGTANNWDGELDEIRIAQVSRSIDWIVTEYNNQDSPSTFYSIGLHEYVDTILLSDDIEVNLSLEKIELEDTIYLSERIYGIYRASYATRMEFYDGFLYISTDESPAQIVKVNIGIPSPDWIPYPYNLSGENLNYAKDLHVNQTFDEIYVACADGKIIIIKNLVNLDIGRETIEVETGSGANSMIAVDSIDDSKSIYLGTNSSTAELYKLDESIINKINTDLRTKRLFEKTINTGFDFIKGKLIKADFRFLATQKKLLKTDLRFYSPSNLEDDYDETQHGVPYNYLKPIEREDFSVKINGTQISDVDLISIIVRHIADETSTAEFVLGRYHDKLDYMLDGTPSEITNKNPVQIYIKNTLIFDGKIKDLSADVDSERVTVIAEALEWMRRIKNVDLAIASVNEQQNLYHALVKNVSISKPDYDLGTTQFTGLSCKAGDNKLSGSGFTQDMEGEDIDIISGTHFVKGSYTITRFINENNVELDRSPTEKSFGIYSFLMYLYDATGGSGYVSVNPPIYRGVKVDLGDIEEERVLRSGSHESSSQLAEDIEFGDWIPTQNWTYFWRTSGLDLLKNRGWSHQYLGTNLAPIVSDIYEITSVTYNKQRTYPNWIFPQGYYYVGNYPYRDISAKNGKYIAKTKYEDRANGLYRVRSESYDFLDYAKKVANLEYEKIVNINGNILPITSANIDLTIDGFLYYNLQLLTRINIVNTIQTDIYKNNNGFPVSIKSIEINSKDMLVHLSLDNAKSQYELQLIDGRYPDEPIVYEEYAFRIAQKFDLPNWSNTA